MMRTRVWWLIGLMVALLGSGLAQSLVLTNGDVNGNNQVDDADLVSILFAMGRSCPSGCPEDLNGDRVVDDADFAIVLFNLGAQGAPAFAGQVQSPQGAFSVSLTVRLGDWVGSAQQVKMQLKPVGRESDATVPIFEYRVSVGGTDTTVPLANLPAGAYTVRAFAESSGRWLHTEGKLITEVPWIFAVPTGANKVTVYWDEVSGATGYRVRWGTVSGSYPNSSTVLPATARQHTVSGLIAEHEYYFVVEAEYNGLWGSPSEVDSAIPHVGAIPWDSGDPQQIMPALRRAVSARSELGDLEALGSDGLIYTDFSVEYPEAWFYEDESVILYNFPGSEPVRVPTSREGRSRILSNVRSGPYRRVATNVQAQAVAGIFFVPSVAGSRFVPGYGYSYIDVRSDAESPWIYFGVSTSKGAVEAGLSFHPAGRGGIPYPRWQITMNPKIRTRVGKPSPVYSHPWNPRGHIRADDILSGGVFVLMELRVSTNDKKTKLVKLTVIQLNSFGSNWPRELVAAVNIDASDPVASWRRVHSMAQIIPHPEQPGYNPDDYNRGYLLTGSYVLLTAAGYNPIQRVNIEPPIAVQLQNGDWVTWNETISDRLATGVWPSTDIVRLNLIAPFSREVVGFVLPPTR